MHRMAVSFRRNYQATNLVIPYLGVEPKNRGVWNTPKMDGENNGSKPYEQMDDLGGFYHPYFWKHPFVLDKFFFHNFSRPPKLFPLLLSLIHANSLEELGVPWAVFAYAVRLPKVKRGKDAGTPGYTPLGCP